MTNTSETSGAWFDAAFWTERIEARDTVLTSSVAQMQDKLERMRDAGVQQVYVPTFLPAWHIEPRDRFITEVAPALR